jgi:hypothetical protein
MTVFTWKRRSLHDGEIDGWSDDTFHTEWAMPDPACTACGDSITEGQLLMAWNWPSETRSIWHASCIEKHTIGIIQDFGKIMRKGSAP